MEHFPCLKLGLRYVACKRIIHPGVEKLRTSLCSVAAPQRTVQPLHWEFFFFPIMSREMGAVSCVNDTISRNKSNFIPKNPCFLVK